MPELPKQYVRSLQDLGTRLLDSRKPGTPSEVFARELLAGFHDTCMHAGLDKILVELGLDLADRTAIAENTALHAALVTQLDAANLDGGGPRAAKPRQVADAVIAALGLTLVDEADRSITLDHALRVEIAAAMANVVESELAVERLRESIVSKARALCDERYLGSFDKIIAQLDDRGMRMIKQPKVPLDASQSIQQSLFEARTAVFTRMGNAAIDRAKDKLPADAAERIDQPVTHKLTPRETAILRVCDARVPKMTPDVVESLLTSISEMSRIAWRAPERPVRTYGASQTFAVGELIEHPKFGRGEVKSTMAQRIEVEFSDGKKSLVHVPAKK